MHDFANYKQHFQPEAVEEDNAEWAPDIPSIILGIIFGLFLAVISTKIISYKAEQVELIKTPVVEATEEQPFVYEFYDVLKNYEVLPRTLD